MNPGEYLLGAGRKPWEWGEHDCCTFAAGWAMLCGHADPMAGWRGAYSSEEEARRIMEDAGGLVVLWSAALAALSRPEGEPQQGDIGICNVIGEDGPTANGGIFTGGRWSFLAPRGLCVLRVEPSNVTKVWRP